MILNPGNVYVNVFLNDVYILYFTFDRISFIFFSSDVTFFFSWYHHHKKKWWWNLNTIVVNETHIHRHRHPSINSMHFIRTFFDDNDDDGIDMDWFALPSEINRLIHYNSNFDPIFCHFSKNFVIMKFIFFKFEL